jgi:manganese/zinc/iron transport system permease protein
MINPFDSYTVRTVAVGVAGLGALAGGLGCFAVLRRQSLLADAAAHAALPGVVLAFLLTGGKGPLTLALGAGLSAGLGTLAVAGLVRGTRTPYDAGLAIVLSVFFGLGTLLLSVVQSRGDASHAGLERFLFGQAATLLSGDVTMILTAGALAMALLAALGKEFQLLSFDPAFLGSLGYPVAGLDAVLTLAVVAAVVVGLQAVGVALMAALVVAPAVAARPWVSRLGPMLVLAAGLGGVSGFVGTILGDVLACPLGPAVTLSATGTAAVSLLAARGRAAWRRSN